MRTAVAVGLVLGLLLLVASAPASSSVQPRLVLVSDRPVVVAGRGFHAYEKIRLLVTPGPSVKTVRAGRLGRFRVRIGFSMPRCGGVVVQALGNRGSRAMVDRPGPDCTPIG